MKKNETEMKKRIITPITYGIILWIIGCLLLVSLDTKFIVFVYMIIAAPIMIFLARKQACVDLLEHQLEKEKIKND